MSSFGPVVENPRIHLHEIYKTQRNGSNDPTQQQQHQQRRHLEQRETKMVCVCAAMQQHTHEHHWEIKPHLIPWSFFQLNSI